MENRFGCKLKSSISIALSFPLFFQPFLTPLAQAQTTSTTHSISYDTNGNMTQDENGNTYEYDAENKLISFVKGDGTLKTEYTYYADGLRKSKQITLKDKSASDPIVFYYDHGGNANVVNEVQGSGNTAIISSYLMVGDTRYARYLSNDASGAKYYVKNHKDTTMTVGANGENPISHSYTPYGEERDSKGTDVTAPDFSIASNPFLYSSEYTDQESGLQYLRARYYKADHMRFISRDTNSVPRNKYAYANGNPIMEDDPSGMMASWVRHFLAGAAGFVAGGAIEALTGGAGTVFAAAVGNAAGMAVEKGILGEEMTATDLAIGAGVGAAGEVLAIAGKAVAETVAERLAAQAPSSQSLRSALRTSAIKSNKNVSFSDPLVTKTKIDLHFQTKDRWDRGFSNETKEKLREIKGTKYKPGIGKFEAMKNDINATTENFCTNPNPAFQSEFQSFTPEQKANYLLYGPFPEGKNPSNIIRFKGGEKNKMIVGETYLEQINKAFYETHP